MCPPARPRARPQAQIVLGQSQRMHCTVCFTRGQERQAHFAVEGLPAHVKAGVATGAPPQRRPARGA